MPYFSRSRPSAPPHTYPTEQALRNFARVTLCEMRLVRVRSGLCLVLLSFATLRERGENEPYKSSFLASSILSYPAPSSVQSNPTLLILNSQERLQCRRRRHHHRNSRKRATVNLHTFCPFVRVPPSLTYTDVIWTKKQPNCL